MNIFRYTVIILPGCQSPHVTSWAHDCISFIAPSHNDTHRAWMREMRRPSGLLRHSCIPKSRRKYVWCCLRFSTQSNMWLTSLLQRVCCHKESLETTTEGKQQPDILITFTFLFKSHGTNIFIHLSLQHKERQSLKLHFKCHINWADESNDLLLIYSRRLIPMRNKRWAKQGEFSDFETGEQLNIV